MESFPGYDAWKLDYPRHYDEAEETSMMIVCAYCNEAICHEAEFLPDDAHEDESGDCYHGRCWTEYQQDRSEALAERMLNPDNGPSDAKYRQDMRDAGRGHLLG